MRERLGSERPAETTIAQGHRGGEPRGISGENSVGPVGFEPTAFGFRSPYQVIRPTSYRLATVRFPLDIAISLLRQFQ